MPGVLGSKLIALIALPGIAALLLARTTSGMPDDLAARLERAPAGSIVRLDSKRDYGEVVLEDFHRRPSVIIEAGDARMRLIASRISGLHIKGGRFGGSFASGLGGRGISLSDSSDIVLENGAFADSRVGLVVFQSKRVSVSNATFRRMTADGINVASSSMVTIDQVRCSDFLPSERHPDCVQLWSRPGRITSDVRITRSEARGRMQGFTAFNSSRNGINDGGFDRVAFEHNIAVVDYPHGVTANDCRQCRFIGNRTSRSEQGRWPVRVRAPNCSNCEMRENVEGP